MKLPLKYISIYMQGLSDIRATSVLIGAAARLSLTFGLHQKVFYSALDPAAANRRKRAFWISYILDRSMSVNTGVPSIFDDDAIGLDYPDLIVSVHSTIETSQRLAFQPPRVFDCRLN
jgi:hypothetical protein